MESGRIFFDPSACHGNMLFLGNRDPFLRGARSMMNMEETSKRRPFFSSQEDLFDEEYYEAFSPEKKRRLTVEQVHLLEESFEAENKLEPERKVQIAKKLGMQPRQVAVWFQNRRARWKTKQLERDYEILKSSYDSLLLNYESIAKENEKLKSEIGSLTEKLQVKDTITEPLGNQTTTDSLLMELANDSVIPFDTKIEDRLSYGSDVVDEDGPQRVDSVDSYFPNNNDYPGCMRTIEGFHSEEDDGSDDGQSYFPNVFMVAEEEQHEEPSCFWVWS